MKSLCVQPCSPPLLRWWYSILISSTWCYSENWYCWLAVYAGGQDNLSFHIPCFLKLKTWLFSAHKHIVLFRRDNPYGPRGPLTNLQQLLKISGRWVELSNAHMQRNSFLCLEFLFPFGTIPFLGIRLIQLWCWIFIVIVQTEFCLNHISLF